MRETIHLRRRDAAATLVGRAGFAAALGLALALIVTAGVPTAEAEGGPPPLKVCVSVPPQAFLADRVGGGRVTVSTVVRSGQSPHTFEPTPGLIARLSASDVCFTIGLPFEQTVLRDLARANPGLVVFDSAKGIVRHGLAGRDELDPHVWLSPKAAEIIAANIRDGLVAVDPADSTYFNANLAHLVGELKSLDRELADELAPLAGSSIYVFHPAYGYFAEEFGLHQISIEVEGKEPGPRDLTKVVSQAKRDGARAIFVQPQHPARIAQTVADEIGAKVVVLDPLAYDYFGALRDMAGEIAKWISPAASEQAGPERATPEER